LHLERILFAPHQASAFHIQVTLETDNGTVRVFFYFHRDEYYLVPVCIVLALLLLIDAMSDEGRDVRE
jgi:hypothetical protein